MATQFYAHYFPVLVFLVRAFALSAIIFGASYVVATHTPDPEKQTAYECGFDPFDDARDRFDIRFYLVAIRFIIFDLEASFLFPWAVVVTSADSGHGRSMFWVMFDFLGELAVGYGYAWQVGALDWE